MSPRSRPLFAPTETTFAVGLALSALWNAAVSSAQATQTQCLSNKALNDVFAVDGPIPKPGSCCMQDVCGLACPVPTPEPSIGASCARALLTFSVLLGASVFSLSSSLLLLSHWDTPRKKGLRFLPAAMGFVCPPSASVAKERCSIALAIRYIDAGYFMGGETYCTA